MKSIETSGFIDREMLSEDFEADARKTISIFKKSLESMMQPKGPAISRKKEIIARKQRFLPLLFTKDSIMVTYLR